jgi:hypothetical protein
VADVEDGAAALLQAAHDGVEALDLDRRERRGRLVEHEDARVGAEPLGDLDHLLLADRERRDLAVDVEGNAEQVEQRARPPAHRRAVGHDPEAARLAPEVDVLRDREGVDQREFLMDDAHAELLREVRRELLEMARRAGLVDDLERAGARRRRAAQDLHQRRLAGAVLADERVADARLERERDRVERRDAAVALRDREQACGDAGGHFPAASVAAVTGFIATGR